MTDSASWNDFYKACCDDDLSTARKTVDPSIIDKTDADGNTVLHKASSKGHIDIVHLLLRHHASRIIKNSAGKTAEDVASTEIIKELVKSNLESTKNSKHFVAARSDVEWLDTYNNAYRIAYENLEHMKRWLLKVPLEKLLDEINTGYIDKNEKVSESQRNKIKAFINNNIPVGLIKAYSCPGILFHEVLNYDLAEIGSNFRFLSTQNLFNTGYLDNEAPKDLGQHIFAAILINRPYFEQYHYAGTVYRGMNITEDDLKEYELDKIVLTRSFLSSSKLKDIPMEFLSFGDKKKPAVLCTYKIQNPQSSLSIKKISQVSSEDEVLILPFVVFKVTKQDVQLYRLFGKRQPVLEIELEECYSNP